MVIDTLQVHLTNQEIKNIGDYIVDYSFLITLIVGAFLGFILNRIYESLSFREKRKFFFHALYELKNALEHQLILYENYIKNLKSGKNHLELLQLNVGFNLKNIEVVSREIIYKIFAIKYVKSDKSNRLNRLTALNIGFNLIQHHNDIDEAQDEKIRDINKQYLQRYSDSRTKLLEEIDIFLATFPNQSDAVFLKFKNEYLTFTKSFYTNFDKTNHSIFDDNKKFLEPLFDIVKKYGFVELIHEISKMFHIVQELDSNRNDAINKITEETDRLKTVFHNIVDSIEIYKEFLDEELLNKIKLTTKLPTKMDNQEQAYKEAEEKRQLLKKELEKEANDRRHESQTLYDKYLISLSTASLGFSVAFIKESDFIGKNHKWILVGSWLFFVISTVITLISFKTSVNAYKKQLDDISNVFEGRTLVETMPTSNKYTKFINKINLWIFIIGILLTFLYICLNL